MLYESYYKILSHFAVVYAITEVTCAGARTKFAPKNSPTKTIYWFHYPTLYELRLSLLCLVPADVSYHSFDHLSYMDKAASQGGRKQTYMRVARRVENP